LTAQDVGALEGVASARTVYRIDAAASRVEFTIRKRLLFVARMIVTGHFSEVQGTISLDEREPATARAVVTIGAASVDTRMGKRDKHLRKADFFDVKRYPNLSFQSRRVETIDRAMGRYRVVGDLTVRDVTREVALDARYTVAHGEGDARRIRLTLDGSLNRRDFGIVWNRPYLSIPDDLAVRLEIEATPA
jgi:polyisoprenoid-binding protein YceI